MAPQKTSLEFSRVQDGPARDPRTLAESIPSPNGSFRLLFATLAAWI